MFDELSREELEGMLHDAALNWLAHDGLWFLAVEAEDGMDTAVKLDAEAWSSFTIIEAKRIMKRHGIEQGGGIPALAKALGYRLYALINEQEIEFVNEQKMIFRMLTCRVQVTRRRKGLADFPCKPVGKVEFSKFAETIDPRIRTRCLECPPDDVGDHYCSWEFTLADE